MAVIHNDSMSVYGVYSSMAVAIRVIYNAISKGHKIQGRKYTQATLEALSVSSDEHFNELDTIVEVKSLFGGMVKLRKSEVGGPCDPSTERYWSM